MNAETLQFFEQLVKLILVLAVIQQEAAPAEDRRHHPCCCPAPETSTILKLTLAMVLVLEAVVLAAVL